MDYVVDSGTPSRGSEDATVSATEGGGAVASVPDSGTQVGRYVVIEPVGRGGMGVVLAAFDPELDRKVAIKLLHRDYGDGRKASEGRSRMLREAQALARLSHANVVSVHDVGLYEDRIFIAMEFVAGCTMSDWIEREQPDWRTALGKYIAAGRGLAAAHAAGLVHRDFKPHNVLIGEDGRVRVTDFGLARSRPDQEVDLMLESLTDSRELVSSTGELSTGEHALASTLTRTGARVGTPAYMAPEQFSALPVDPRADQFSFCVALYEAVYGERPFKGRTALEIATRAARGRVRSAPASSPVPQWLRRALLRGLAPEPADRHPSMDALLDVLAVDPWRRWRRTALMVLPPLALGGWWVASQPDHDACASVDAKLDGIWNRDRKKAIESRFVRTGLPYAQSNWETVRARMDALSESWAGAERAMCERAEQDVPVGYGRRMACLHRRYEELRSYSELLADADAGLVEHAVTTVEALGTVGDCEDESPGMRSDIPGEAQREIVEALARTRVLGQAGRYEAAVEAAEQARAAAEAVDDRWLGAEATFELGKVTQAVGRVDDAQRAYDDAFSAGIAAGHDEVVARSAIAVAGLELERDKDFAEAENWMEHAGGAVERMGPPGEALQAELQNVRGRLAHGQGDYESAREAFQRGLEIRTDMLGEDAPQLASYHVNLGHALANLGRFEQAVANMRRALELEEKEYSPDHPRVASTLTSLCSVLRDTGQIEPALDACKRAVSILRAAVGENHPRTGTALVNLGSALADADQGEQALEYFEAALASARAVYGDEHPRTGLVLNNLSVQYELGEDWATAEDYARRALATFEKTLGEDHPTTAVVASNLANLLSKQERHAEAEAILRRNAEVLERRLGPDHPDLAVVIGMLGETFIHRERLPESIPYLERTVKILDTAGGHPFEAATARFALGATLFEIGEQRERGLALVRAAAKAYREAGARADQIEEIDAWLAEYAPEETAGKDSTN